MLGVLFALDFVGDKVPAIDHLLALIVVAVVAVLWWRRLRRARRRRELR